MYRKYEVEVEAMSISYWVTRVVKDVAEDFLDCHIQSLLQDARGICCICPFIYFCLGKL